MGDWGGKGFDSEPILVVVQIKSGVASFGGEDGQGLLWINGVYSLDNSFSTDSSYAAKQELYFSKKKNIFSYYSENEYQNDAISYQLNKLDNTYCYLGILQ